ncbi:MAG TPA: acyl-CoA thioesterase [Polyangiaceae bacterium]|nr:acyl-CoA thioesterase [Polyangiaceae bacterium]
MTASEIERPTQTPKQSRRIRDSRVTLHQFMLPAHANAMGNVHGGVILKIADEAAAICAMRHAHRQCVTVAIDSVSFHSPVHVGQLLALEATLTYVGRSSLEVHVSVHAEDPIGGTITHTNSAYFVFVALDGQGRTTDVPPIEFESDEERARFAEASERQKLRIARAKTL